MIEPAKARGKLRPHMLEDDNDWWAEFKYHGSRYLMHNGDTLLSRHVSVKNGEYVDKTLCVPHLITPNLKGTVLDGEIILKLYGTVRDVTSIMGSAPALALQKQRERGYLHYMVFDILFFRGEDIRELPLHKRRRILEEVYKHILYKNKFIHLTKLVHSAKSRYFQSITQRGGEGIILKHKDSKYGERSKWVKWKVERTYDVVIMGFLDPKPTSVKKGDDVATITRYKKKGWIGSIIIGQWTDDGVELIEYGSVSGMDEHVREKISRQPDKYIGTVIEIKAQSRLASGSFEHPRFIRWRDDKDGRECIYDPEEA